MQDNETKVSNTNNTIHVLLADDDSDDRLFFEKVLKALPVPTQLVTIVDGEKLMTYLFNNSDNLPDVLFLDLNMPRKNGSECLSEIKINEKLKQLPVIIYSTSLHEDVADLLYNKGAQYYVRKTDLDDLRKSLYKVLTMMTEKKFARPARDQFILSLASS
ncbi:MAG: response regulator [Ferruginibacter sp.]